MTAIYKQNLGAGIQGEMVINTAQTLAIETQNEAIAAIFMMPNDDTITTVGFVNGTATNAASITDNSYTLSVQGVDGGGLPDNTILGGGTPASVTFPQSGQAGGVTLGTGTSHILTLDNSIALQGGTRYSLVIFHTGATDATNFITPRYGYSTVGQAARFPYSATKDATDATTVWTRSANFPAGWFVRSATRTYLWPGTAFATAQTCGTTTERGFSFVQPAAFGTSNTYAVRGIRFTGAALTAAGTFTLNLYANPLVDNNLAIQQTTGALDSDVISTATGVGVHEIYFPEDSLVALTPGTTYGIGLSMSAAGGFGFLSILVPDSNCKDAYQLGGMPVMSRTIAAYPPAATDDVFTSVATTIIRAELILGDFTASAAGGSQRVFGG